MIRLILPLAGIVFLFFMRGRLVSALLAPMSLGRWFLATGWAVLPVALFFAGLALEKGRMYSAHGLAILLTVLIGIWAVTGLPTIFLGVLKAIKSRKVRVVYAQTRGLKYVMNGQDRMEKDFLPKSTRGFFNFHFSNLLFINPGVYIAGAVRNRPRRGLRGSDVLVVEGVSLSSSISAVRSTAGGTIAGDLDKIPGKLQGLKDIFDNNRVWVGDAQYLVIIADKFKDFLQASNEKVIALSSGKELVQSILNLIAQQGPNVFEQVEELYIHKGRIVLGLTGFLDTEDRLDAWVDCSKKINEWVPTSSER